MLSKYYDDELEQWIITTSFKTEVSVSPELFKFDTEALADEYIREHKLVGTRFEKMEELIELVMAEHRRLSSEAKKDELDQLGLLILPEEIRWKLHVAACSITDYTFWVYECDDDGKYFKAYEVETGMSTEGVTAREALEKYFTS